MKKEAGIRGNGKGAERKSVRKVAGKHGTPRRNVILGDIPPPGVDEALHREIMRRINNRYYDTKDLCSMRRGGPGLPELAGVIPLTKGLGAEAIATYAGHLEKVISTRGECERCEAKVYAILCLIMEGIDSERARGYGRMVRHRKDSLGAAGESRNFFEEVKGVAEQEAKRIAERNSRHGRITPAWQG